MIVAHLVVFLPNLLALEANIVPNIVDFGDTLRHGHRRQILK